MVTDYEWTIQELEEKNKKLLKALDDVYERVKEERDRHDKLWEKWLSDSNKCIETREKYWKLKEDYTELQEKYYDLLTQYELLIQSAELAKSEAKSEFKTSSSF